MEISSSPLSPFLSFSKEQIKEWKTFYEKNGYLVIQNFASHDSMDELKAEIQKLTNAYFLENENVNYTIFSTLNQEQKSDKYFIESGDKIRFFFEEGAFDSHGTLRIPKDRAINKVGHALFDLNETFHKFTCHPAISFLARSLGMQFPLVAQSMYIFKQPTIGGFVKIHQDNTFLNTKPLSCMAFWFALEEVTLSNGCLWVAPGSHTEGIVKRFRRNLEGTNTFFSPADAEERAPWLSLEDQWNMEKYPEKWIPLPCSKGSLVVIHGSLVHMSQKNQSPNSRHVYTFHMIERDSHYSGDNWLQRPAKNPFQPLEENS